MLWVVLDLVDYVVDINDVVGWWCCRLYGTIVMVSCGLIFNGVEGCLGLFCESFELWFFYTIFYNSSSKLQ